MKKSYNAVLNWGLIIGVFYGSMVLSTMAANKWGVSIVLGVIASVVAGCAKGYQVKWSRYTADVWGGRPVIQETESGRVPHYEVLLSRSKPSFLWQPLKHLFRPWPGRIGKVHPLTGSISVTSRPISEIGKTDPMRWELGTNEYLEGSAAAHVKAQLEKYQVIDAAEDEELTAEAVERYQTILRLKKAGLQLV